MAKLQCSICSFPYTFHILNEIPKFCANCGHHFEHEMPSQETKIVYTCNTCGFKVSAQDKFAPRTHIKHCERCGGSITLG